MWFRGPSATGGFFRNRDATEKLFPQGAATREGEYPWVNSGDRAYRADGEIYVTGRVKDIIIKGGRNLYPHEVEELAARVEGIRKGCIVAFGLKDEASGTERLMVVAEAREATPRAAPPSLRPSPNKFPRAWVCLRIEWNYYRPEAFQKLPAESYAAKKPNKFIYSGTLSQSKAPAWLQIARLGAAGAWKRAAAV